MLDQLPHKGIAIHLAELAVEEPISMPLSPGEEVRRGRTVKRNGFRTREE